MFHHQRAPWRRHPDLSRKEKMWRCSDPPSMWQMCYNPFGEVAVGLTAVELGNLLAGLHPRNV